MLGAMHSESWDNDPKHLGFVLARYKFVSKMLTGKNRVLEVGCGDMTGSRIVKSTVRYLEGIDIDAERMASSQSKGTKWEIPYRKWDILDGPLTDTFDAIYALDVMEHIDTGDEPTFMGNIMHMLEHDGVFIVGAPSLESQVYASLASKAGHVNCKTEDGLRKSLEAYFYNVFLLGMNDEVLTCAFGPMCQYRLAICAGPKS
jgi:2-polyprenyl-3-methyl-5-hydroxy-6-metoxy-1,4-benzoquinol methylase